YFWEDALEATEAGQSQSRVQRPGGATAALLEGWIERESGKEPRAPLFAFLHLYEPHAPYEPPEPFRSRYASRPYDGEIAAADAVLGESLAFLKRRGLYDPALVIVLSDHGESLGEHGEDEHGVFVYRSSLQVPLLVKLPKKGSSFPGAGQRVAT